MSSRDLGVHLTKNALYIVGDHLSVWQGHLPGIHNESGTVLDTGDISEQARQWAILLSKGDRQEVGKQNQLNAIKLEQQGYLSGRRKTTLD